MATSVSQIRQNFHEQTEKAINVQINWELWAAYFYQSMAFYFDRDDVALPGFSHYFKKCSDEEREHAEKLMKYLNSRGGRIILQDVKRPSRDEWGSGVEALQAALDLEKKVNQSLLDLHKVAEDHSDPHLSDFLEEEYLKEQVEHINELGVFLSKAKRCGPGIGEYIFDKELKDIDSSAMASKSS